jgi:hypothetical protein
VTGAYLLRRWKIGRRKWICGKYVVGVRMNLITKVKTIETCVPGAKGAAFRFSP